MSVLTFPNVPPPIFNGVIAQLRTTSKVMPSGRFSYCIEGRGIQATVEYVSILQQVQVTLHANPWGDEMVRAEIQAAIEKASS